jgi:hypothetical protein
MKSKLTLLTLVLLILFSACVTYQNTAGNSGKVPPGQAKKASGSKSAKQYAPGQQK